MPDKPANASLPKITVITPSLNQGRFLEQCIQSVLNQNYPELEYIIIDGESTDNSIEIIKKYQTELSFWVSEPDQGQSDAINKGFRRATGNLLAWLNADDFYLPDVLHYVAQTYRKNSAAPFYFGDGLRVNEQGHKKQGFFPKGKVQFNREALCLGLNYILQPATFINRQSMQVVGGLSSTLQYGMDTDLWLRLSALGEPVPIQLKLAASREYAATKSASGSFARIEELRQISEDHTGLPLTPGVVCYFLDTFYRSAQEHPDVFPADYQREILRFWGKSSLIMGRFGAAPDGFPLTPAEQRSSWRRFWRTGKVYLRNLVYNHIWLRKLFWGDDR